jgi:hypothetical protein
MLYTTVSRTKSDTLPAMAVRGVFYSQWAYWCTLAMAAWSYGHLPAGATRTMLVLTPVLLQMLYVALRSR